METKTSKIKGATKTDKQIGCLEWALHKSTEPLRCFSRLMGHNLAHIYAVLALLMITVVAIYLIEETTLFGKYTEMLRNPFEGRSWKCSLSCVCTWVQNNPIVLCLVCPLIGLLTHYALADRSAFKTNKTQTVTDRISTALKARVTSDSDYKSLFKSQNQSQKDKPDAQCPFKIEEQIKKPSSP